ncbi:recQ-mediated genome instability protein 2 [Gouania willdenowi]|uniref:RecQ-mediated genome instability protein 2 n=1 Tax=Gouania willdenowi TaxID=441366 RepID=A0A8C5EGV8_GOUWI|nr:recQ-mediated genome instability protein 2 [Gouania willdenowi]
MMSDLSRTLGEKRRPPPVKVLSGQLRVARSLSGESWVIRPGRGRTLPVSLVWMQGTVLEVHLDSDSVLLMDETGTFTVQGVSGIPRGKPCLSPGKYVMVMGVIQAVSPEPLIRAVKIADLSVLAAVHRHMWKLEVEELQDVLTDDSQSNPLL